MNEENEETQYKEDLRRRMRALRKSLPAEVRAVADAAVADAVCGLPAFQRARTVFAYVSIGTEVDTREIIRRAWAAGKAVAAPRVVPGTLRMDWYRIDSFAGMERSAFGVEEPPADAARLVVPPMRAAGADERADAVALVPGYSFDADGYRLGYGGGFYDVFLAGFGGASIGLCRQVQMSPGPLPREEFDRPVDFLAVG